MEQIEMEEVGNIKENFVSENEIADTDLDSIAISETKDGNTYDEETGNKSPSTKKISEEEERQRVRKQFYITLPWSPQMYFTVRGAENFHIYLWIAKDIAWTQDEYWPCMIFGCSALAWCSVLVIISVDNILSAGYILDVSVLHYC